MIQAKKKRGLGSPKYDKDRAREVQSMGGKKSKRPTDDKAKSKRKEYIKWQN